MNRRGRPPHPDILTPREWEVLGLLRERLSDQAIADRLGVSLDGAKYHVREILSKLGVSSRQEAAAWQPSAPAPPRRWLAVPLALRVAGAIIVLSAVAGLGLLAWGVLRTGSGTESAGTESTGLDLPTPQSSPHMNADAALLKASTFVHGDIFDVRGALTTWAAARAATGDTGSGPGGPGDGDRTWFFEFDGIFTPEANGSTGPAPIPIETPVPHTPSCGVLTVFFPDTPTEHITQAAEHVRSVGGYCSAATPVSREFAIVLAARTAGIYWPMDEPPTSTAERMTAAKLRAALSDRSAELSGNKVTFFPSPGDTPVWLVTFSGQFFEPEGWTPDGGTPRPTTVLSCADRFVILGVDSDDVLFTAQSTNDACN